MSALARPLPVVAIVVLLVNDHLLKGSGLVPGWVTGKLSDVAGLFFFPILLAALLEPVRVRLGIATARAHVAVAAATALVFAALELSPVVAGLAARWMVFTPDPTDLLALPAAGASWWWLRRCD